MKLWTLVKSTLESFLHNRLIVLLLLVGVVVVLIMLIPLTQFKSTATADNKAIAEGMVLEAVSQAIGLMSGLGSLLSAWAATDAVCSELKSGTVLAVMARPVKRWEFLLGKYLGVLLLMAGYAAMMIGVSYVLAWIGGQRLHVNPVLLFAYPLARYAIYAAIAILCATATGPAISMAAVLVVSIAVGLVQPGSSDWKPQLMWLKTGLYYLLPSMHLLSEERFLSLRQAALRPTTWVEHGTGLLYGIDYALVVLLLAMWSFQGRSLRRD